MELRQIRYFVRVVELGSMSRAALELDMVQSALSQQISRLEGELATRLLQRTSKGVLPTEAGLAFFSAAQQARLSGSVSVGMAPTTAAVLGGLLLRAMRARRHRHHLLRHQCRGGGADGAGRPAAGQGVAR